MTRHESPLTLTDGTWARDGLVHRWHPSPPPDTRRRCRDCDTLIGPRKHLCEPCRVESRRRSWGRSTNARRRRAA